MKYSWSGVLNYPRLLPLSKHVPNINIHNFSLFSCKETLTKGVLYSTHLLLICILVDIASAMTPLFCLSLYKEGSTVLSVDFKYNHFLLCN